jgi:flagellar basal-body rod modification protein FlgD
MQINSIHPAINAAAPATPATPAAGSASTSSSSGSSPAATGVGGVTLGGTDFLTLMLAQLKNQDPTSPVDSNVFLTQLAELSQVQGITQLNTSFTNLSNSLVGNQAMQASSLLGHQALVPSSTATIAAAGTSVTGAVAVPQTSAQVLVNIADSGGNIVQQVNLGAQSQGIANFTWDGTEANGAKAPIGQYSVSAQVAGVAANTNIPTYISGTIQSVTMGAGSTGMSLNVAGQGPVLLSNVLQISN